MSIEYQINRTCMHPQTKQVKRSPHSSLSYRPTVATKEHRDKTRLNCCTKQLKALETSLRHHAVSRMQLIAIIRPSSLQQKRLANQLC